MPDKIRVKASSGSVVADLGVAKPDLALAKAELASQIYQIIRSRRLKQAQVAEILSVGQGKVSALVRGRLAGFSTERLFWNLNALGRDVKIVISEWPRSRKRSRLTVTTSGYRVRKRRQGGFLVIAVDTAIHTRSYGAIRKIIDLDTSFLTLFLPVSYDRPSSVDLRGHDP